MGKDWGWVKEALASSFVQWLIPGGFWSYIIGGLMTTATVIGGVLQGWSWPVLLIAGVFVLACCSVAINSLSARRERINTKNAASRPTVLAPRSSIPSLPQVPVRLEFNPESDRYFNQKDSPERYREYYCTVFNNSDETLRNVSCELDHIITYLDRPTDHPVDPQTIHEKLAFDLPTFPKKSDFPPQGREKLWLFSRLKKELDNEPIRIVKTSASFYDRKRKREVVIRVTADHYRPKTFRSELWVQDGILRMTGLRPEN